MIARQLQKRNLPRVQSVAMKRVQMAAWQMTHSPGAQVFWRSHLGGAAMVSGRRLMWSS